VVAETSGNEVSGAKVFELYDTSGFQKIWLLLILKEKGYTYNETDFEVELQNKSAFSMLHLKFQPKIGRF
jgi:alanyl-tRNA synthetase